MTSKTSSNMILFFPNTLIICTSQRLSIYIKEELNKAKTVCVTVDEWTDKHMKSFLGITAHFIDDNWEYKSLLFDFCIEI